MSGIPSQNRSMLAALLLTIGTVTATIANLSGVIQLRHEPPNVIMAVLALVTIGLSWYSIETRKNKRRDSRFWLPMGAIVCALMVLGASIFSLIQQDRGKSPVKPVADGGVHVPVDGQVTNLPPKATVPLYSATQPLYANMGIDLDVASPEPVAASSAAGNIDVFVDNYGLVYGAGKGFYSVGNIDRDEAESTCRTALTRNITPSKEVFDIAGTQYCFRTSEGNVGWLQIVGPTDTNGSVVDRGVNLAMSIWGK